MERVILNAFQNGGSAAYIRVFDDLFAIVFRHGESPIGEADPTDRPQTSLPAPQTNHKLYSPNEEAPE